MDVGFELRQAREQRSLSLQQLSNITKISPRILQAIEASDENRLPAPVFARSFVRAYAAEVALDPDTTMHRYFEQFSPPPAAEPATASLPAAPARDDARSGAGGVLRPLWIVAAVLVAVAATALFLTRSHTPVTRAETPSASAPVIPAPGAATIAPPAAGVVGTSGAADALHLVVAPTGPCWVQATIGGSAVLASLLASGDRRELAGTSDVTLRVGDPAACAFSINGSPARVPGAAGRAVTVRITRENYRQFLTR